MRHLLFLLSVASASAATLRVMSYNLYGWNAMGQEAWKKPNLWKTIMAAAPDVLGVQEVQGFHAPPPRWMAMSMSAPEP